MIRIGSRSIVCGDSRSIWGDRPELKSQRPASVGTNGKGRGTTSPVFAMAGGNVRKSTGARMAPACQEW